MPPNLSHEDLKDIDHCQEGKSHAQCVSLYCNYDEKHLHKWLIAYKTVKGTKKN